MNGLERIVELAYKKGISTAVIQGDLSQSAKDLLADWNVYPVFDRRSMTYYALGVSQEWKAPVLLLINDIDDAALSDTLPGITEAFYQNVPLLVLAVDRGRAWLDNPAAVIGDKCVFTCNVSETGNGFSDSDICQLNDAMNSLTDNGGGPVFIEYRAAEDPKDEKEIPVVDVLTRSDLYKDISRIRNTLLKQPIHLVLDASEKYSLDDIALLKSFCTEYNAYISSKDVYFAAKYLPLKETDDGSLVLYFGENHTYSIQSVENTQWVISPELHLCQVSRLHIRIDWRTFVQLLNGTSNDSVEEIKCEAQPLTTDGWNIENIVCTVIDSIKQPAWITGLSVQGVNLSGIIRNSPYTNSASFMDVTGGEGLLSVFVGQSIAAKDEMCMCFIDQRSFFRDMNALHIQAMGDNARIVMFGNEDGANKAAAWASSCGFESRVAVNEAELLPSLKDFSAGSNHRPQFLAVIV